MSKRLSFALAGSFALSVMLAACGGGGGSGSPQDVTVGPPPSNPNVAGPNSFLLFPNPQMLADGSFETNTEAYALAYYRAIDPNNNKDTLAKWKAANGFGSTPGALGEVNVIFGDTRDLGYGRRMTVRQNPDGTIAAFVENYLVNVGAGYSYSSNNLEAAINAAQTDGGNGTSTTNRWHVGSNAIEFSPGPNGTVNFVKFYTFEPTGERRLMADLDGRGKKAMPGICLSCHGGRGDPLTLPDANGNSLFALVQNAVSRQRGDATGRMQMLNVDTFDFSTTRGYTRADLEASLKTINKMVLCSYPIPTASNAPEDACRPIADSNEWQGTAADALKAAYGGDGLPNAAFSDTYIPDDWRNVGQSTLFNDVVNPMCMTCHRLRGTGNQSDLNFMSYAKFASYADRIKAHVFDRGNMPLARIVADRFWSSPAPDELARWLESLGAGYQLHDSTGALLKPGRPVADPGPDRVIRQGATTLSAANSLYATTYNWSIVTNPGGTGFLTNTTSATPTFTATADGTYVLQLVVGNGSVQSTPVNLTLVVKNALSPAPSAIRFADVKSVLQGVGCTSCHTPTSVSPRPPIFYTDTDRNGDGVIDSTDDAWFYKELRGRINFTDIVASPLLRKPSNHHHAGLLQPNFDNTLTPGDPGRANYDLFLNWILNGAPQ